MPEFWIGLVFTTLVGACVGSFLNVVAYRIPEGISLVLPRSACPKCKHLLAWFDNVPVLGWFLLKGKCRHCQAPISKRYPTVEAITALFFGGWFALCYATPLRPAFFEPGPIETSGIFMMSVVLIAALIGSSLVDAEWTIIPLRIPYFLLVAALVVLPMSVILFPRSIATVELPTHDLSGMKLADAERLDTVEPPIYRRSAEVEQAVTRQLPGPVRISAAPLAGAHLAAGTLGALAGLAVAIGLLVMKLIPRSFEFEQEEPEQLIPMPQNVPMMLLLLAGIGGAVAAGLWLSGTWQSRWLRVELVSKLLLSMAGAYALVAAAAVLFAKRLRAEGDDPLPQQAFAEPEHPRLEACKELLFLFFPAAGAACGWAMVDAEALNPWLLDHPAVSVFVGSLGGALAGAAIAWGLRVFGTLGFGREAMGLGDMHLMVGIGAVVGWRMALMIFLFAAFSGLAHTVLTVGLGKLLHLRQSHVPYGPHLAVSTGVLMILREPMEAYFAVFVG